MQDIRKNKSKIPDCLGLGLCSGLGLGAALEWVNGSNSRQNLQRKPHSRRMQPASQPSQPIQPSQPSQPSRTQNAYRRAHINPT